MNVEKKPDEGCTVKLIVKADAAEIADECKKVLNTFLREAAIPGFRKGKVPLAVIQQKFADGIKQESEQACFRKLYPQALKEAAVEPIELTGVTDVLLDPADFVLDNLPPDPEAKATLAYWDTVLPGTPAGKTDKKA